MTRATHDERFHGEIAGIGTTSGVRIVLGHWHTTPMGSFSDVMVERADGHRVLIAPTQQVADFVESTYMFDEVRLESVSVTSTGDAWQLRTPHLEVEFTVGRRTPLGTLLRVVPQRLATAPRWTALTDPLARVLLQGTRTRGSAGGGRTEFYGATGVRRITSAHGAWDGADLGRLAPVDPPCRFGFSSTPRTPSITSLVTTVRTPS